MTLPTPSVEYFLLCPTLIVFGIAVFGVLAEAFLPRGVRYGAQVTLALGGLTAAFVAVVAVAKSIPASGRSAVLGSIAIDRTTLFFHGHVVLVAVLALIFIAERSTAGQADKAKVAAMASRVAGLDSFTPQASAVPGSEAEREAQRAGASQTELFPLAMLSVRGMMVFPASNDLLTMFVALEVLSLPLYIVCGLARHRRLLSQEAALKYFLLGAFSSAFFLYGAAMLYGYAGSVNLEVIAQHVAHPAAGSALLYAGVGLLGMGLLFKVGAAPFHMWTPDVYQGAPTPITGFMAAATKIAAFGALVRVLDVGLGVSSAEAVWRPVMQAVAIITMVVGGVLALTQRDIKRMLAYSAILNAGYLLIGVTSTTAQA